MAVASRAVHLAIAASWMLASAPVGADDTGRAPAHASGYMGVAIAPAPLGLRVVNVAPASPAAAIGLVPGDVITGANGGPPGTPETFTLSVRAAGAGATYPLQYDRGGEHRNAVAHLVAPPRVGLTVGAPPPALVGHVAMGSGSADLEALHGRVVVLDFWASWCGPCRMAMPALNQLHRSLTAQGLTVLGVTDESDAIARSVGMQMGIGYTLATEPTAAPRFGITGLPTMVVIDRRGTVRRVMVGVEPDEMRDLEGLVRRLLAEPAGR